MPRKLLLNLRAHLQLNKGRNAHSEGTAFATDLDLETQYSESVRNPVQAGEAGGADGAAAEHDRRHDKASGRRAGGAEGGGERGAGPENQAAGAGNNY